MTNSDTTFGTYNKLTKILTQVDRGDSTTTTNFADVAEAKSYFFTTQALAVFDECCTELQWEVVDNQKLKFTMTFGTKGTHDITEANDWSGQYVSRQTALENSSTWVNAPFTEEVSTDHLF